MSNWEKRGSAAGVSTNLVKQPKKRVESGTIVTYTVMTLQASHTKHVQDFTTHRALTISKSLQGHF